MFGVLELAGACWLMLTAHRGAHGTPTATSLATSSESQSPMLAKMLTQF